MSLQRDRLGFHRVQLPSLAEQLDEHEGLRQVVGEFEDLDALSDEQKPEPPAPRVPVVSESHPFRNSDIQRELGRRPKHGNGDPCRRCGKPMRAGTESELCKKCQTVCPLCGGPKNPVSVACFKHRLNTKERLMTEVTATRSGIPTETTQVCKVCGQEKLIDQFRVSPLPLAKGARLLTCISCVNSKAHSSKVANGTQGSRPGHGQGRHRSIEGTIATIESLRAKTQRAYDTYVELDQRLKTAQAGLLDIKRKLEAALS